VVVIAAFARDGPLKLAIDRAMTPSPGGEVRAKAEAVRLASPTRLKAKDLLRQRRERSAA